MTLPSGIDITAVPVCELDSFARSAIDAAEQGEEVPISPQRARAQSRNPYAEEGDIGLFVAHRDGRCAGYIGIVPGRMRLGSELRTVDWLTAWYVVPELRGQGLGYRLLREALALPRDTFGTGYRPAAERVFRQAGFLEFGPVSYGRLDLRAGESEGIYNRLRSAHPPPEGVGVEEVDAVEGAAGVAANSGPRFPRGPDIVNWMLDWPWVLEPSDPGADPELNYYFSNTRPLFRHVALAIGGTEAGRDGGYAVLSLSGDGERTSLTILDHAPGDHRGYDAVLSAAFRYADWYRVDDVVLPAAFGPHLRGPAAGRLRERRTRGYLCCPRDAEEAREWLDEIELSYCDGDAAFTH